jgi:hypothetical protein
VGCEYRVVRVDPETGDQVEVTDRAGLVDAIESIVASIEVGVDEYDMLHGLQEKAGPGVDPDPKPVFLPRGITEVWWWNHETGAKTAAPKWALAWAADGPCILMVGESGRGTGPKIVDMKNAQFILGKTKNGKRKPASRMTVYKRAEDGLFQTLWKAGKRMFFKDELLAVAPEPPDR